MNFKNSIETEYVSILEHNGYNNYNTRKHIDIMFAKIVVYLDGTLYKRKILLSCKYIFKLDEKSTIK